MRDLGILRAAIDEGSVSRAAARLGMSQPGLSSALARMRRMTGDPLLVRTPTGMQPTCCAIDLVAALAAFGDRVNAILATAVAFDPATSARDFRIACADHAMVTIAAALTAGVRRCAPHVTLHVQPVGDHHFQHHLARGDYDLAIGYLPRLDDTLRISRLREVALSVIVAADHPGFGDGWNESAFHAADHIGLVIGADGSSAWIEEALDAAFAARGHLRRKAAFFPSQAAFPPVVARSDLVGVVVADLAVEAKRTLPIRMFDLPLAMPTCHFSLAWHDRCHADPAHRWLRAQTRAAALSP